MEQQLIKHVVEAALLAASQPLTNKQLAELFVEADGVDAEALQNAIESLMEDSQQRGVELKEVASGYRYQVRPSVQPWVSRMWTEKPAKYSRALLETLSLIAYRQPITRGEIEQIRGVAVSTHIIKTLEEREWIRVVGHRDVPGRPALFGTTRGFLDYFSLRSLDELPPLTELQELPDLEPELPLEPVASASSSSDLSTDSADEAGNSTDESGQVEPNADGSQSPDSDADLSTVETESEQISTSNKAVDETPESSSFASATGEAESASDQTQEYTDAAAAQPSASSDESHQVVEQDLTPDSADSVLDAAPTPTTPDSSPSATEETSAEPHVEVKNV